MRVEAKHIFSGQIIRGELTTAGKAMQKNPMAKVSGLHPREVVIQTDEPWNDCYELGAMRYIIQVESVEGK